MNVLDLFSGIGGFSLGLERAGMRTVAFCEIEPYCRAVLRKHWPDVPIFEDVHTLTAADVPGVDVICGGFPCQPFSQAGKRLGNEDHRALWPEYRRLVEELRPTWVIGENVIGLRNMGLDEVLTDLENCGYSARTFDIPAGAIGANHRRRRFWIIANSESKQNRGASSANFSPTLTQQLMPTPKASRGHIPTAKFGETLLTTLAKSEHIGKLVGLFPHPDYVDWMMGFPIAWGVLRHQETPLSPKSQKSSAGQSCKPKE